MLCHGFSALRGALMPPKQGRLAWLRKKAEVQQWERLAVWAALFVCMGWKGDEVPWLAIFGG